MKIIKIINEKYGQNNYLVTSGKDAILIDASANVTQVEENLKLSIPKPIIRAIFITHEHFDHIVELDNLVKKYKCPVFICEYGKSCLYNEKQNLSILDIPFKVKEKKLIKTFKDGAEFDIGDINIKCYHTPGHSMGSSCFVIGDSMFVGDTVFKTDIGRSDLFGGDKEVQKISLIRLNQDLAQRIKMFYSGHGANFDLENLKYNLEYLLGEDSGTEETNF